MSKPTFSLDTVVQGAHETRALPEGARTDSNLIEEYFDRVDEPNEFVESIYEWWQEKGFLTAKQFEQLEKIVLGMSD